MLAQAEGGSEFRVWEKDRSITNVGHRSKNFVQFGVWSKQFSLSLRHIGSLEHLS